MVEMKLTITQIPGKCFNVNLLLEFLDWKALVPLFPSRECLCIHTFYSSQTMVVGWSDPL